MKKLDKLIIKSYLGPFVLTFIVVVFILLSQTMIKYFDDFAGKGLGLHVFAELLFYFSIFTTPVALPLAALLSSLMTFGNLGEHSELTAIKSSGISLLRTLLPIFIFVLFITVVAYYNNNYIVPKANLKAYSLLYDIKKKKPALDIKEGAFYSGIRDIRIKVNKKYSDGRLEDVIIYDHRNGAGNSQVLLAEAGKMYSILNESYLALELYNGSSYAAHQTADTRRRVSFNTIEPYKKDKFDTSKLILSLAEFSFNRTDEELFKTNRLMLNVHQLERSIDSLSTDLAIEEYLFYNAVDRHLLSHMEERIEIPEELVRKKQAIDSLRRLKYIQRTEEQPEEEDVEKVKPDKANVKEQPKIKRTVKAAALEPQEKDKTAPRPAAAEKVDEPDSLQAKIDQLSKDSAQSIMARIDSVIMEKNQYKQALSTAISKARFTKSFLSGEAANYYGDLRNLRKYEIEKYKKFAQAFACIVMFLIGAPLGAIIKKGGLGVPVIISIVFFIIYYVLSMTGEKWARQSVVTPFWGVWGANFILLPIGLFFLKQARRDARLFDADFYNVAYAKLKDKLTAFWRTLNK